VIKENDQVIQNEGDFCSRLIALLLPLRFRAKTSVAPSSSSDAPGKALSQSRNQFRHALTFVDIIVFQQHDKLSFF